jgi:phage-related baseplate assembly protein
VSRFAAIDLSKLPFPEVIETVDAEAIVVEMRADFMAAYPAFTADLESETAVALLEEGAYRETILRARVNDGARAVMLPYATGADLDTLAASMATERAVVDPGDPDALPPVPETLEDDDRLRARAQLAWEGLSVAGPEGAYIYHALSADPRVRDVDARAPTWDRWDITPEAAAVLPAGAIVLICEDAVGLVDPYPGDVAVTILSTEPEGTPSADLLATVAAALNGTTCAP